MVDEEKQRAMPSWPSAASAAEDEASAIRAMMNAPKKVLVAKKVG